MVNRKEPEPHYVISAPAPGGNLISTPRLSAPQHWLADSYLNNIVSVPSSITSYQPQKLDTGKSNNNLTDTSAWRSFKPSSETQFRDITNPQCFRIRSMNDLSPLMKMVRTN